MAIATIDTELTLQCVGSITESANKIKELCDKHLIVLDDLAEQTNIKPIVSLAKSFDSMCASTKAMSEAMSETEEKTKRYCDIVDEEINGGDGGLYTD